MAWRWMQRDREILAAARRVPAVVLHYELVPGVTKAELDEDGFFDYLVEIEYRVDQPVDWECQDDGDIDPAGAGPRTPGFSGLCPLPDLARMLRFTITGFDADGDSLETPNGALVVDLTSKCATWVPATDSADSPE